MPQRKRHHLSFAVMVVDDDPSILRLLEVVLGRTWAFRVVAQATSCEEAIELLANPALPRPEVVLLDYLMPGVNGGECALRMRELLPTAQLVVCTVVPDRAQSLVEDGIVDGVLDKSELPSVLVFALYKLLYPQTTFTQAADLDVEPPEPEV